MLEQFAWKVAGPRDAAINAAINAPIVWYFVPWSAALPLWGRFSVATFLGPMSFLLFFCATFFGVMNGVMQRKNGWSGQPLRADRPWRGFALCWAATLATLACAICLAAIYLAGRQFPDFRLAGWGMIALQTLLSAALGYCVQANGVLLSKRL